MAWVLDKAHAGVEFAVKHMVISTVRGRFSNFEVDVDFNEERLELSSISARIEAASIDTKEDRRDAHLRSADFLDAENFPWITFQSKHIRSTGADGAYQVVGDLTIRGVTREVVLNASFSGIVKGPRGNLHTGFEAETAISRRDFGLNWNMALEAGGWLVGDNVKISLDGELIKQD